MPAYDRPFPIDATMTAIAIGYKNRSQEMLHSRVLPAVRVSSEDFKWLEFPIEQYFTQRDLEVGRKSRVNEVEFFAEEKRGYVRDFGLDDVVPITDIDEARRAREGKRSRYDPEAQAVEGLTNLVDLGREVRAAAVVQDPNNYDAGRKVTLAGDDQFSDYENSDPYAVLNEGMTKPLVYRANTVVMGQSVWEVLKRHPRLIKAAKGGLAEDGAISRAQFAELMEIELHRLLIGVSMVNAAKPGQPVNLAKVWGNSIEMLYIDDQKQSPTDSVLTWGFTADLEGRIAGAVHEPNVGLKGGMRVRVGERVNEIVCAKSLGYMIDDPI